jgi:hypothetical protein
MTKVLIVDVHAEMYRDALHAQFSALQFTLFHKAVEVSGDLSDRRPGAVRVGSDRTSPG